MNAPLPPERIRELLGGYATGTLTPEERAALMQAALEDQDLFDTLMDEEALRETLSDRAFRSELVAALQPSPRWWRTPWPWAALASATAAVALFVLLRPQPQTQTQTQTQVATLHEPREIAANLPKPEPQPSEILVPRTLRMHEPPANSPGSAPSAAPDPAGMETKSAERADAGAVAGNAAPAVAFQAMSKEEGFQPAAPAAAAPPPPPPPLRAEVQAAQAKAAPAARLAAVADASKGELRRGRETGAVEVDSQQPDGSWKAAEPGAPLPAGRALRLRLTSPVSGTLLLEPGLADPLTVQAGVPAEWVLPAQSKGELVLRISLAAPGRVAAPMPMRAAKSRAAATAAADSAVAGAPSNGPVSFPREIRLRIE